MQIPKHDLKGQNPTIGSNTILYRIN